MLLAILITAVVVGGIMAIIICKNSRTYRSNEIQAKNTESQLRQYNSEANARITSLEGEKRQLQLQILEWEAENLRLRNELSKYTDIIEVSTRLNVTETGPSFDEIVENEKKGFSSKNAFPICDLNPEKREIYDLMENSRKNVLITGKAGTGKSYLLKCFRANTSKRVIYAAPTGVAAINISGVTLHSCFGFQNLQKSNSIRISQNQVEMFKNTDALVIDEISMVRADVLERIDEILKHALKNSHPFGGIQLLLFGDIFQLPPVAKEEETSYLNFYYGGIYFFNAPAFKAADFQFRELEEVFRQKEKKFVDVLNRIREGSCSISDSVYLNMRCGHPIPDGVIHIVAKKAEAESINAQRLDALQGREQLFQAEKLKWSDTAKETDFTCAFSLKLRLGAQVMMISNDVQGHRWVNGTIGRILALHSDTIVVAINGAPYEISKISFKKYKCVYDKEKGRLEYIEDAIVKQYPVILAYAITIHKSQGMTYQQVACDLSSCFAPGQAYVALSRCANYSTLFLLQQFSLDSVMVDQTVLNFYRSIKGSRR